MQLNSELIFDNLCDKYHLNIDDKEYLSELVMPIINNDNFLIRMTNLYPHHGSITLGEHILEDTIMTFVLSKKYIIKKRLDNYRLDLAIKIALLHDLYTIPWQNNKEAKVKHFFNKHGFRHPIEAVINGITWYPEIFNDSDSTMIIDGVLHHMFPLPVRKINKNIELRNKELYDNIDEQYKEIINNSLKRKSIGGISISRSKYKEGRIMAKADRIVSRKQIKDLSSAKSLLTGKNKKVK